MSQLLIIDDDLAICRMLELHFRIEGHSVSVAHSVDEGLASALQTPPELIILDIRMSGKSGLEGLLEFKIQAPNARVIMITAFHDMESTIQAMQGGADDYIHKPIDLVQLDKAVRNAFQHSQPSDTELDLVAHIVSSSAMVGSSSAMREVFKTIGRVSGNTATVLITGESGTGKELVARAIHNASDRRDGPFVAINCAALVETLLESEMFGHERGSFSGAVSQQLGKFALAENGTLFLDEVGELSLTIQAKLLRVLQEREFVPLGGKKALTTNARIITATNVNLQEAVKQKRFREDIYYRLEVVQIQLPPLRERQEDIIDLVPVLLSRINRDLNAGVTRVSSDVMEALQAHRWPGNVRELENVLTKAVALCPSSCLTPDLLPTALQGLSIDAVVAQPSLDNPQARCSLKEMEQAHVYSVLQETDGHKGQACEILGISRPRLQRMLADFNQAL
ncbi:MAG: two-component system response regulator AtoC [Motiliproteus sp.]|jgi:two-component system response regulator AtoC